MVRIGICDDSPAFLQQAQFMIDHWDHRPSNVTTELFEDGDALLLAHSKKPFDILLLDIVMPLLSGMDAARELREKDKTVKIVFLTSSPEFAVESYSVKASNYLLKPVEPDKLFACLSELIAEVNNTPKYIVVKSHDTSHKISLSSIEYIESQNKHIIFYTADRKVIRTTEPLYTYENMLTAEDGFFKCHRSYIVNIHHIESYSHLEVITHSGCRIPISRSNQKVFEEIYFRVVFEKAGEEI